MSPRAGLDRAMVVYTAASLADDEGLEDLSLSRLAGRLGVRKPSLYNHVSGLPGLKREMALLGLRELGSKLSRAAVGKAGNEGIFALAEAYRTFVKERPGLYEATVRSFRFSYLEDPEFPVAEEEALEPVRAVLASCGVSGANTIHAARGLRSIVHGFATLEVAGGFGMSIDLDESFQRLVRAFAEGLRSG